MAVNHAVAIRSHWVREVRWPSVVVSHGKVEPRVSRVHPAEAQERERATPGVLLVNGRLTQLCQPSNNALLIIRQIELIL